MPVIISSWNRVLRMIYHDRKTVKTANYALDKTDSAQNLHTLKEHHLRLTQLIHFTKIFNYRKKATFNPLQETSSLRQMMTAGISFAIAGGYKRYLMENSNHSWHLRLE